MSKQAIIYLYHAESDSYATATQEEWDNAQESPDMALCIEVTKEEYDNQTRCHKPSSTDDSILGACNEL